MVSVIIEIEKNTAHILQALEVRMWGRSNVFTTPERAFEEYLSWALWNEQPPARRELEAKLRTLRREGEQFFQQGYRLKKTPRFPAGVSFTVPRDALAYQLVSAGYLATHEARRVFYLIKKLTP